MCNNSYHHKTLKYPEYTPDGVRFLFKKQNIVWKGGNMLKNNRNIFNNIET